MGKSIIFALLGIGISIAISLGPIGSIFFGLGIGAAGLIAFGQFLSSVGQIFGLQQLMNSGYSIISSGAVIIVLLIILAVALYVIKERS